MTNSYFMSTLNWIQLSDTENALCAPTDEEFQEWLKSLDAAEGPDCLAPEPYATQGIGQPIIRSTTATSLSGLDDVYTAEEEVEVAVSLHEGVTVTVRVSPMLATGGAPVQSEYMGHLESPKQFSHLVFRHGIRSGNVDRDSMRKKKADARRLHLRDDIIRSEEARAVAVGLKARAIANATDHVTEMDRRAMERTVLEAVQMD